LKIPSVETPKLAAIVVGAVLVAAGVVLGFYALNLIGNSSGGVDTNDIYAATGVFIVGLILLLWGWVAKDKKVAAP
jgi:uncharacterized BrkB/YihY/UPF0761 family membrane protein